LWSGKFTQRCNGGSTPAKRDGSDRPIDCRGADLTLLMAVRWHQITSGLATILELGIPVNPSAPVVI